MRIILVRRARGAPTTGIAAKKGDNALAAARPPTAGASEGIASANVALTVVATLPAASK